MAEGAGRPREFDTEAAVEAAMQVFWARGYEGASIAELTSAMGIGRPSLYAAFGDKRGLFERVLQRYGEGPLGFGAEALALPRARDAVRALLRGVAAVATRNDGARGCLVTQGALACSAAEDEVKQLLAKRRRDGEARLKKRLDQAKKEGELGPAVDTRGLARFYSTVAQGLNVQGATGVTRRELEGVVELAMLAWPGTDV